VTKRYSSCNFGYASSKYGIFLIKKFILNDFSKHKPHFRKTFACSKNARINRWFLADFGGTKGIRNILKEKLHLPADGFKLVYKKYSWEEQLDNYEDASISE
jgi:hypothetical protein